MRSRSSKSIPSALTIAGSDSGGGAGIQADLKTFVALGVHGLSVITVVTAQNPKTIGATASCSVGIVLKQLECVFEEFSPRAIKIGMLPTAALVKAVARFLAQNRRPRCPVIVDTVMVATSGAHLSTKAAIRALRDELLPFATLITPNLAEAQELSRIEINDAEDLRLAARKLQSDFGCAALVKGGHLRSMPEAVDILRVGDEEWIFRSPYVRGVRTHGTGCTFSAAICAYSALGKPLVDAVLLAKRYITSAIRDSVRTGSHLVLRHW